MSEYVSYDGGVTVWGKLLEYNDWLVLVRPNDLPGAPPTIRPSLGAEPVDAPPLSVGDVLFAPDGSQQVVLGTTADGSVVTAGAADDPARVMPRVRPRGDLSRVRPTPEAPPTPEPPAAPRPPQKRP